MSTLKARMGRFLSIVLCFFFACSALIVPCVQAQRNAGGGMGTILMIVASENFRDEELLEPLKIFKNAGYTVKVASTTMKEAKGMLGVRIKPDMLIDSVRAEDYDAVVFVGGAGAKEYWDNPVAHKIAQEALRSDRIVAAICLAPVTLAHAGILKNKKATVWSTEGTQLQSAGAKYTGEKVARDGNIITGDGPFSAIPFANEILNALNQK